MFLGNLGRRPARALTTLSTLAVAVLLCLPATVNAAQVLLNETFENDSPDSFPGSADFFARSSINPDPNMDPSTAVVTGGAFADPFNPGSNASQPPWHDPNGRDLD